MTSILTAFPFIGEQSFATPGAFNSPLSIISANIAAVNAGAGAVSGVTISPPSGNTIQMPSDLSISGYLSVGKGVSIGTQAPGIPEPVALTIGVNSGVSDYFYLNDTANLRSDYLIGSHAGGTADGLNIFDVSGNTMIVSFSKQSVRFYQNVIGATFDTGGQSYNVRSFGALGDGTTDDTAAIQLALNTAAIGAGAGSAGLGGVVSVPAGTYQILSQLTLAEGVCLRGAGQRASRIRAAAVFPSNSSAGFMVRLGPGSGTAFGTRVEDMFLECGGNAEGAYSSNVQDGGGLTRTLINNFRNFGIQFDGSASTFGSVNAYILQALELYKAASSGMTGYGLYVNTGIFSGLIERISIVANVGSELSAGMWFENVNTGISVLNCQTEQAASGIVLGTGIQYIVESYEGNGVGDVVRIKSTAQNVILKGIVKTSSCTNILRDDGVGITPASTLTSSALPLYVRTGRFAPVLGEEVVLDRLTIRGDRLGTLDGSALGPPFSFTSETSLGWYRSAASILAQSYGTTKMSHASIANIAIIGDSVVALGGVLRLQISQTSSSIGSSPALVIGGKAGGSALSDTADIWFKSWNNSVLPQVVIAAKTQDTAGFERADLVFGTRLGTTNILPVEQLRITAFGSAATDGTGVAPSSAYLSEQSLGLYRSGVSTMALSYGTFNLASNAVRLSMRTQGSLDSTNLAVNEVAFSIQPGSSGASLAIRSGGTIFYFASSNSTKAP